MWTPPRALSAASRGRTVPHHTRAGPGLLRKGLSKCPRACRQNGGPASSQFLTIRPHLVFDKVIPREEEGATVGQSARGVSRLGQDEPGAADYRWGSPGPGAHGARVLDGVELDRVLRVVLAARHHRQPQVREPHRDASGGVHSDACRVRRRAADRAASRAPADRLARRRARRRGQRAHRRDPRGAVSLADPVQPGMCAERRGHDGALPAGRPDAGGPSPAPLSHVAHAVLGRRVVHLFLPALLS